MGNETMDIEQLAAYLQRDARELGKLASRGLLPARKVGGEWRFARAEINHWVETQIHDYDEKQLAAIERGNRGDEGEPLIAALLSEATIAVPLPAATRASVLRELVALAERSWQVYDPETIFVAIKQREELASTAMPFGVALPHPRRPLPDALGENVMAFGRTGTGIPFGGPRGELTDLFFLILCRDDRTHLRVLARLTRLLLQPGLLEALRAAETPAEAYETIAAAEQALAAP
jgi:PTS system nitrogen regulatory IIA component